MTNSSTCRLDYCDREARYKITQLCNAHHVQHKRGKELKPLRTKPDTQPLCAFDGCGRPSRRYGLCTAHCQQHTRLNGKLAPLYQTKRPAKAALERDEQGRKQCSKCRNWHEEAMYATNVHGIDGLSWACYDCRRANFQNDKERQQHVNRLRRFNMTEDQFRDMFEAQGHACATCGTQDPSTKGWVVDHDHSCCAAPSKSCGKCIRGILCSRCNCALGFVKDNADTLAKMVDYLSR